MHLVLLLLLTPMSWAVDADGDGHAAPEDCDDADPSVHPAASEIWYDGDDQDCDGASDFDRDADGFDDASAVAAYGRGPCTGDDDPIVGCGPGHDCNDSPLTGAEIHPLATQRCDPVLPVDHDCDGSPNTVSGCRLDPAGTPPGTSLDPILICPTPSYPSTPVPGGSGPWFPDDDDDGEGDIAAPESFLCDPGLEEMFGRVWVRNRTDCDDDSDQVHTRAVELCNERDDNCDGLVDEPTASLTDALDPSCVWWTLDVDRDGFGMRDPDPSPVFGERLCLCDRAELPTCEGGREVDGRCFVPLSGDCDDGNADVFPRGDQPVTEWLDGLDHDCDGLMSAAELDCDGDGAFALPPTLPMALLDDPAAEPVDAATLGLAPCTASEPPDLPCGDAPVCEPATGLWMVPARPQSPDRDTCAAWDCDDGCASRCVGHPEVCDGIDNDCLDALARSLAGGAPTGAGRPGEVPVDEVDLDGDGAIACEAWPELTLQVPVPGSCEPLRTGVPESSGPVLSVDVASCRCSQGRPGAGWLFLLLARVSLLRNGPPRGSKQRTTSA